MNLRKLLLSLHLVTGLVAALVLFALGATGAMLVFENEIDRALNPALRRVQPRGEWLPLDALAQKLEQAHPGMRVSSLFLAQDADAAFNITLRPAAQGKNLSLAVDPYTGDELGQLGGANTFTQQLHQFHKHLLLGEKGKLITGSGAVLLLVLATSGVILWWPRKLWGLGRAPFALHNAVGICSSAFMLLFGATGAVIHWDNEAMELIHHITGAPTPPPLPKPRDPAPGAVPWSAGQALDAALRAVPGARATSIQGLGARAPIRITMKYPEDHTPAGRTNLFLDPTTGEILSLQTSRTAPWGTRIVKLWNRELHTGDLFGWPTRILACIASLALPLLAITGPLIWWGRFRRRSRIHARQ